MRKLKNRNRLRESSADRIFMFFVYFALVVVLIMVLFPLLHVLAASLSDPQKVIEGKVSIWPQNFTLRGYEAVFKYPKIMKGFANSLIYVVFGTLVNVVMTLLAAFPLSRKEFRARKWLSFVFVFTMIFSGGLIPTFLVVQKLGLYNSRLAMILPVALSVWNVMITRTYMINTIPDDLYEAASIDGSSPFHYFLKVVLPLCKPIIAVLVLYYGVVHWNSYFNALIYLRDPNLQPLQIALRELLVLNQVDPTLITNVEAMREQQGLTDLLKYSVIVVSSMPMLILYPFVQKYFVKGVMVGSVKG